MIVTPLTFITFSALFYLLLNFLKDSNRNIYPLITLLIIFEVFIDRGYFIDLGLERLFFHHEFLLVVLSPLFLLCVLSEKYDTKVVVSAIAFLCSIGIGFILLIVNTPEFPVIKIGNNIDSLYYGLIDLDYINMGRDHLFRFFRVILYLPVLFFFGSKYIDYNKICRIVFLLAKILSAVLIIELLMKMAGLVAIYDNILIFFFNDGRSVDYTRAGLITLSGLTREPSHLSFGFFIPLFMLATKKENNILLFYTITILLIISMSFANFALAIIGLIVFFTKSNLSLNSLLFKTVILFVLIMIITVILVLYIPEDTFAYNLDRVFSFFTGDYIGSEGIRLWSIIQNLEYFIKRPLFGLGLGSTISLGFIPSMLANIGLIGSFLWYYIHKKVLNIKIELIASFALLFFLFFSGDIGWLYSLKGVLAFIGIAILTDNNKALYDKENHLNLSAV